MPHAASGRRTWMLRPPAAQAQPSGGRRSPARVRDRQTDPPPPPYPLPPLTSPAALRRIESAACIFTVLFQLLVWRRTFSTLSAQQHAHQAALSLIALAALVILRGMPCRAWLTYRVPVWILLRTLLVSVPSYRSTAVRAAGGGAQLAGPACPVISLRCRPHPLPRPLPPGVQEGIATLLHRAPTPGLRSAVVDFLVVSAGTRQLMAALFSCLLHLSPLAVAAQQTVHVALSGSPRDYCRQAAAAGVGTALRGDPGGTCRSFQVGGLAPQQQAACNRISRPALPRPAGTSCWRTRCRSGASPPWPAPWSC